MFRFLRFNLKISQSAILQLSFIAFLIVVNFIQVTLYDQSLSEVEKTVDLAESNGTYSQKIPLYAKLILEGNTDYRQKLRESVAKFEQHLENLKNGGRSPENNAQIAPIPPELRSSYFKPVETLWQEYQRNALLFVDENVPIKLRDGTINPQLEEAYRFLLNNSELILDYNNQLVDGYLNYFDDEQSKRDGNFALFFAINMFFVLLMFIFIIFNVSRPISKLNEIGNIISEGNFDRKIEYRRKDELGEVASSINSLFQNLKNATDFILAIGEGKLDTEYQGLAETDSARDRLGSALMEMRDKMSEVAEADRQRRWASEGLAKFAEIFRNQSESENFTYIIISNLVQYIGANQGGLFIVEDEKDEDSHLELVAAYAYEKRKYLEKRVNKGEGLVGEAYQEGSLIYMTDVPDEYVHITSGLGEANPRSILMVPLKLNEEVYGVVELASFAEFKPYQIEFVEKLGESIASTFASVKNSRQTQTLLRESLQLSEQMKAQEEEMRQNLEELVATQEEVQRKNQLIEDQKGKLEESLKEEKYKVELLEAQSKGQLMKMESMEKRIMELERENELIRHQKESLEN